MLKSTFKQLSSSSCQKSKQMIADSFSYHPTRGQREKAILMQTLSDASLGNTLITKVTDSTKSITGTLGLVALSVGKLELEDKSFPSVIVDYLFVDYEHRNKIYEHLEEKVSTSLLYYAIQIAEEIARLAGVRYLILRPDGGKENKKLVAFYESMEFRYMTDKHEWMYLKLT
ncbi:hypothetical protein [Sulfurimonas sp.]|uniref:hypothetical protein n=1 Tax=Sulfurimonas sp. TaxID=2022749 RepID=UPI0025E2B71B|nr:hypothetical protein [Sulfurimonas sp.]